MLSVKRLTYIVVLVVLIVGAFAVYSYIEKGSNKTQVQQTTQINREFFPNVELANGDKPRIWVFATPGKDAQLDAIYRNVKQYCQDLHFEVLVEPRYDAAKATSNDIIIFCDNVVTPFMDDASFESFIAAGGRAVFAAGIVEGDTDSAIWPVIGIKNKGVRESYSSLVFDKPLLPVQTKELLYNAESNSTQIEVEEGATVYVKDAKWQAPIIFTNEYQKGGTCVINGNFLFDSVYMGFLSSALVVISDSFVYPVLGTKSVFLDNFPMLTYMTNDQAMKMYGYSAKGFILDDLAPAFQSISLRSQTPYTASLLVETSNADDFYSVDEELFTAVGKAAIQFGDELIYAANCTDSQQVVFNQEVTDKFKETFSSYDINGLAFESDVYAPDMLNVPGSNIRFIRGMLNANSPELRLSSNEQYTVYPAATFGHAIDNGTLLPIYTVLAGYGYVSHVFDFKSMIIGENDTPAWDFARRQLGSFNSEVLSKTSWLEGKTLSQTADDVKSYQDMKFTWTKSGNQIELNCANAVCEQAFYIYAKDGIKHAEGATYKKAGNGYYLVRVQQSKSTITLKEGK